MLDTCYTLNVSVFPNDVLGVETFWIIVTKPSSTGYEKLDDLSTSWRYSWDLHQELYQPVHQNHLTHPASRTARNNVCCWHPTWAWNASFLPTQLMTFHGAGRWPHDKITSNARTQPYYFHKPLNLDRVHHLSLASEASNSRNEDCWLHMQP